MLGTKIEWCTASWNPVTGCKHGCEYCYARKIAERFGQESVEGRAELDHKLYCRDKHGIIRQAVYPYGFSPTFHKYRLDQPKKWHKPQNIFVCSMADLFGDFVPNEWIEKVFETCSQASQHNYLFLTKNPARYCRLYGENKLPHSKNMWFGSTWTKYMDCVFCREAGVNGFRTFLSIEPMLERMNTTFGFGLIDWIIIGAETGNRKNKVTPKREWIEEICEAADKVRIPVYMKDSLIPVIGKGNMRRELPDALDLGTQLK